MRTEYKGGIPDFVFDNLDSMRTIRTTLRMKVQFIAYRCHMACATIWALERGAHMPSKKTYNKLAKFFDWEVWE